MDATYSPGRRSYYNTSRCGSPSEMRASLREIQIDYGKALDEIQDLKRERAHLKAALNQAIDGKADGEYREYSKSIELASQSARQSYTHRALMEAEQRALELEEENTKLIRLLDNNSHRLRKLQDEILAVHDQSDKIDHLQIFNRHLQNEMQYLDQEFQNIIKRVDELDEEKTKVQIKKSVSIQYSQDYNQTLIKYINYIINIISALDQKDPIRIRFEELFPISSNILKLVANRDFSNLLLKITKFVADLLPRDADQEFPSSTGDFSPAKRTPSNKWDSSPANATPTSKFDFQRQNSAANKDKGTPKEKSAVASPTSKLSQPSSATLKNSNKKKEPQLSVSFGAKEVKPKFNGNRASTPTNQRPGDTPTSVKSQQQQQQQANVVQKVDASPSERFKPVLNERREKEGTVSARKDEYQNQTAAELELIQRERDLIEKERELMEKKRELILRAKEIQEREQVYQEQSVQEKSPIQQSKVKSYAKVESYANNRRSRLDQERPVQIRTSSQVVEEQEVKRKPEAAYASTPNGTKINNAKEFSDVLREKSKHLAKLLNGAATYDDEIQMLKRGEQELRELSRSRERTPVAAYRAGVRHYDDSEGPYASNEESIGSDNRVYYAKNGSSGFKTNSNIASYHPTPFDSRRNESRDNRVDDSSPYKKVSFDNEEEETQDREYQEENSAAQARGRTQGVNLDASPRSGRGTSAGKPRGTQYASFTVSFGRTESAERSLSPSTKDVGSILDAPLKKRVDHMFQTYDVFKNEDVCMKAVRDNLSPQYKIAVEPTTKTKKKNTADQTIQVVQTPTSVKGKQKKVK